MTLIEQLEKAEGPSRELDARVARAIEPEKYDDGWEWLVKTGESRCPAYTSSIDAALTLVPDGWCWDADASAPECGVDWFIYSDGHRQESKGTGATPALAICAAALKARENNDG